MKLSQSPVLFLLVIALLTPSVARAQDPVTFPDAALEAAVREALGILTDPVMPADMLNLTELQAGGRGVVNLAGLEYATNLTGLHLWSNQISDLTPLASLTNLSNLELQNNQIGTLSALGGMTALVYLDLGSNQVSDVTALTGLTSLTWLNLGGNQITDVSALSGLSSLTWLGLGSNQIASVASLASLTNLIGLDLNNNPLEGIGALAGLTNLTGLGLNNTGLRDIGALAGLTNLTSLDLNGNPLEGIGALAGLTNLTWLNVGSTQISDATVLAGLTHLTELYLPWNQITDISALADLTGLTRLGAEGNRIGDISALANHTGLTSLNLAYNQIGDLTPLAGLTNLTELSLQWNQITSISALSGLTGLTYLAAEGNQIGDISALANHTSLTWLSLSSNQINDLTPLAGLTSLTWINLNSNQVADLSALSGLTNVTELHLGSNQISDLAPLAGLTDLTGLNLESNQIVSITPLAGLTNLTWLYLNNNQIVDISALPGLTNLTRLELDTNQIASIPSLAGLTSLTWLDVNSNRISGLSGLAGLTSLTYLEAWNNQIVDLSPLAGLVPLTELYLGSNQIGDLTPLAGLTNLAKLQLQSNQISDLTALAGLTNLTELQLQGNQIGTLSGLGGMTALTQLDLGSNQISDVTALTGLTNLTWLNLGGNQITDASALSGLSGLTWLGLGSNGITSVASLAGLTNLTGLDLNSNPLEGIGALAVLTNLTGLSLSNTQLSDLGALAGLTNLTSLDLGGNPLGSIGALAGLTNLTWLNVGSTQISDVTALAGLTHLTELYLSWNQITSISALAGLTGLTRLGVEGNQIGDISVLANHTALTWLSLSYNQIGDLTPLAGLTSLSELYLQWNQIGSIAALGGLTHLNYLDLRRNRLDHAAYATYLPQIAANNPGVTLLYYPEETAVVFGDTNLKAAFESALGVTDPRPTEMQELTWLGADGQGITSLAGLEVATNLTGLSLSGNQISDLTPLAGLTSLTWINLNSNQVADLSALSGLTNVTELHLGSNQISDLAPLAGLTDLSVLNLDRNKIVSVAPLAGLTNLTRLILASNQIADISALSGLTALQELVLPGNKINNIAPVSGLSNLTYLVLDGNPVADISPVAQLTNVQRLQFVNTQVADISPVLGLSNLWSLEIGSANLTDVSALSQLQQLTRLRLSNCPEITDFSLLATLPNLQRLFLNGSGITNIQFLAGLTGLVQLDLSKNQISDPSPLAGLTNLQVLLLSRNNITDIQSLAGLAGLTQLELPSNKVSDILALAGLTNLQRLNLQNNLISDISPLATLTYLTRLDLRGNLLNTDAYTIYIPAITANNPGIQILYDPYVAPGENILVNGGFESGAIAPWGLGVNSPAVATVEVVQELTGATIPEGPVEGSSCLHFVVSATSGTFWDVGLYQSPLAFQAGKKYTLSAFLKCREGTLRINLKPELLGDPWTGYGEQQFTMTDEWAEYSVTTPVLASLVSPGQVSFHMGYAPGEFWMDGVRFYEGDYVPVETELTFKAREPSPALGAGDVPTEPTLSWTPGMGAISHHVYFGANRADVIARTGDTDKGTQTETSYTPGALAAGITYYWCVDEFDGATTHPGNIWSFTTPGQGEGHILFEYFWGTNAGLNTLLALPTFPDSPDQSELRTSFEGPTNWRSYYGTYARGYLYPPQTGDYTFWIASDDQSQLWLSTDENPTNAGQIANVPGWTPARDFDNIGGGNGGPQQKSSPIPLEAGRRYYIEALCAQGTGGDNLAVAWQGPSISTRTVISGTFLAPYSVEAKAREPSPAGGGAVGVPIDVTLSWTPGVGAVSHHVYFGTNKADVAAGAGGTDKGTQTETSYTPGTLAYGTSYFWRVDEFDGSTTCSGSIWSFTTRGQESLHMWLEAEGGSIAAPMEITDDVTAFGGQYIQTSLGNSTSWPPVDGLATYPFTIPGGTYMVWGRVNAASGNDDSFWVRIQGASTNTSNHASGWVQWNNIAHSAGWIWDAVHSSNDGNTDVLFTLPAGSYTLEIAYREDGTKLDRLLITDYLNLAASEISGITPAGSYAEVAPVDSQTGGTPVTLTFASVTESGETSLTTSSSGPEPPAGFQLGEPATYYDISTTSTYSGVIEVQISYSGISYSGPPELLRLYHYEGGSWVDCTTSVDTVNQVIYGQVTSLSPFVVMLPPIPVRSITADFNGTAIPAGRTIWFNSVITPKGLPGTPVTFQFVSGQIQSDDGRISLQVPDATLTFDPAATCAETQFVDGRWVTRAPASGLSGNTWLSGAGLLSAGLPGGIKDVTWSGGFICDTPGITLQWKWAAAVYTSFPADLEGLGVKAVDGNKDCSYSNSDHAGTPETIKSYVTGGARGGGGSNYTGGYSGTLAVTPYTGR